MVKFIRPCDTTRISDNFSRHANRKPPSGLPGTDFVCGTGSNVYASAGGVVTRANFTPKSGNNIRIHHADGSTTYYLHLSSLWVKNGQTVAQGNIIGKSGSTGNSTGPHLHFSYADPNGILRDPETIIGKSDPVPVPSRRTIKFGSTGADVRYLQTKLGVATGGADGIFGPKTRRAVIAFQKSHGLVADGIVGPKTWAAIG